ncbi:DUF6221 family protein [Streptomyces sp. NBC_00306]|uniref:DUF6221 family protein n=1 Tax=Streptomyces sp. NBC_00306 TaxID=2975708 RepID=UPI002E2A7BD1|nr:DUF6221 family protein [Streptomyces sp. NBC_00306]
MSDDLVAFLRARLDEEAELHPAIARHVAFHDPARVLRVIEAKRRILARHRLSPAGGDPSCPGRTATTASSTARTGRATT